MKFGDIEISNFLAIGEARVILGNRGLINIEGVNKDDTSATSNGAGKSSFADALCWCLFGETARGDKGDAVVNEKAGRGCKVDVEILDGDDQWKVIRHRKHKTGKNALHLWHYAPDGTATDLTQGTDALTQAKVLEIIGCSLEVFIGSVYAGQERLPDLPGMTDKNLKVLVEEAAGTTVLERGHRLALEDLAKAKTAAATAAVNLTRASEAFAASGELLEEVQATHDAWEEGRAARVQGHADAARSHAEEARKWAAECAKVDRASLISEIATHDDRIASVEDEKRVLGGLDREVLTASNRHASLSIGRENVERQVTRQRKRLTEIDHQVGCPCDSCGRDFTASDIAPAKKLASDELDALIAAHATTVAEADAALNALREATERRDAFAAGMTDLGATIAARDAAKRKLDALNEAKRQQTHWTGLARAKVEDATRAKGETNPHAGSVAAAQRRREEAEKAVAVAGTAHDAAEAELAVATDVCGVFAPSGVRAHILDTVTPFLNDRTARYLGTLSDGNLQASWTTLTKGAKGELKEKFSIEVAKELGGKRFSSISGGEKRKVRVACALALQDLVASRATKAIELFIGDEIDDALDPAGVERLMTVLEEKARERGSVFVISHNSLKDWIRETITFVRSGGVSVIQEAA